MSKERLEYMEKYYPKDAAEYDNDIPWVIQYAKEQAERVDMCQNYCTELIDQAKRYGTENKRYREALERISEHEVYGIDIRCGDELSTDAGKIARKALEESE